MLLNDLDNKCLGHYLKIWTDHYGCTGETKGATIPLCHELFIVTSNYSIAGLHMSDGPEMIDAITRRFIVVNIRDKWVPPDREGIEEGRYYKFD